MSKLDENLTENTCNGNPLMPLFSGLISFVLILAKKRYGSAVFFKTLRVY
jgi:hypothetical protein